MKSILSSLKKVGVVFFVIILSVILIILILIISLATILRIKPLNEVINKILGYLLNLIFYPLTYYIFQIRNHVEIIGRENLPRKTSTLFLSNHETFADSWLISWSLISFWEMIFHPERIPWNTPDKKNYFSHWLGKRIFKICKLIPVNREVNSKESLEYLQSCIEKLQESNISIFPAGTRTRNGEIRSCRAGIPRIIMDSKPDFIVFLFLYNIQPIMPIEKGHNYTKISRGCEGKLIISPAVTKSEYSHFFDLPDKEAKEKIKEWVDKSILALKPDY